MTKVFLCGEGPNELGSRFGHLAYQNDKNPGVLHRMLEHVRPSGWEVGGARTWKNIRKYKVQGARHADAHNVLGAALDAKEHGCHVLAFSRDVDNDKERWGAIELGIEHVSKEFTSPPAIVGAAAVPALEGWLLAMMGVPKTEEMSRAKAAQLLTEKGIAPKNSPAMAEFVEKHGLRNIPPDARSLQSWVGRAQMALSVSPVA